MATRTRLRWLFGLTLVGTASSLLAGGSDDWPQFRGPTGDGISAAKGVPVTWSETENIAWKVAVPGRGRSSPVLLGGRIWLTTAVEKGVVRKRIGPDDMQVADHVSLGVVCLNRADGRLLWHVSAFEVDKPIPVHWLNSWATPTPVVEPGRLYCDFGAMGTACLDAESGKVLWTQRLPIEHQVGPGSSPILYKDLLVLVRDGCDQQYVAALDKTSGKEAWKTPRPPLENARVDMKKAFSTPLVIEAGGATQMLAVGAQWAVSYDPATGKELWRVRHGNGWSLAPRPLFGNGMAYVCTGAVVAHLMAIRVGGQGDVTASHVAWKVADQPIPNMSSPILVGKELYSVSDNGVVICFDALTGQVVWRERLPGAHLAAPVFADGRLYFCSQDGRATVLRAGRQFEKLAESRLDGIVVASPAILNDGVFLRTDTHLYRIANQPAQPAKERPMSEQRPEPQANEPGIETAAGWAKCEANPVLGGALGTCFDIAVLKEGEVFRMWFSWRPRKSIALVESKDGIHWGEPLIVLGPNKATDWEEDINRPAVVRRDDGYHMWYTGQARGHSWIGYATSPDGKAWKRMSPKPVLSPEKPWEKVAVMCPHVLWDAGAKLYRMWYSGGEQNEPNAIGYATSPDGLRWSKAERNPIFAPNPGNSWESHKVTACQVVRQGEWHVMFYIGFRDEHHAQIGIARSRDGIGGWQRHPANPIIRPGRDRWDHDACYKPFAVLDGAKWLLWYNGRHGGLEQIGLATHEGEDLGF